MTKMNVDLTREFDTTYFEIVVPFTSVAIPTIGPNANSGNKVSIEW